MGAEPEVWDGPSESPTDYRFWHNRARLRPRTTLSRTLDNARGHLGKARELTKRAVDSAIRADSKENGALWQANAAVLQAAYGNAKEARQLAVEGLKLAPTSQGTEDEVALAFAMAGDTARAESLAQDLGKRFPLDTQMQSLWLPAIQGQLALSFDICSLLRVDVDESVAPRNYLPVQAFRTFPARSCLPTFPNWSRPSTTAMICSKVAP